MFNYCRWDLNNKLLNLFKLILPKLETIIFSMLPRNSGDLFKNKFYMCIGIWCGFELEGKMWKMKKISDLWYYSFRVLWGPKYGIHENEFTTKISVQFCTIYFSKKNLNFFKISATSKIENNTRSENLQIKS